MMQAFDASSPKALVNLSPSTAITLFNEHSRVPIHCTTTPHPSIAAAAVPAVLWYDDVLPMYPSVLLRHYVVPYCLQYCRYHSLAHLTCVAAYSASTSAVRVCPPPCATSSSLRCTTSWASRARAASASAAGRASREAMADMGAHTPASAAPAAVYCAGVRAVMNSSACWWGQGDGQGRGARGGGGIGYITKRGGAAGTGAGEQRAGPGAHRGHV